MKQEQNIEQIMRAFRVRQSRQLVAIAITLFIVLFMAVIYKRPDLFGEYLKGTLFGAQALAIASFIGFTSYNWRCPVCEKYMGTDINRRTCKQCKARLQ